VDIPLPPLVLTLVLGPKKFDDQEMDMERTELIGTNAAGSGAQFETWEKTKDLIDAALDTILNYRQSGHPGGSRSKVHMLVSLLLGGTMRWDIRRPEKRFGDRFVLSAGHTVPLVYCTLAVFNEALRLKYKETGDERYGAHLSSGKALVWEDLLGFRHRSGLSGHAEMGGKTLFLKFNTGPSGHGVPAAAGEALALKKAGAPGTKVFVIEGEGGLTPGGVHETLNSAWGLGLDNLYFLIDWNDYGIDSRPFSSVVYGDPQTWFASHGWRVFGTEQGSEWGPVTRTLLSMAHTENPDGQPNAAWFRTRKGRGYGKFDAPSHGAPHAMNSPEFWATKADFAEKYEVEFANFGGPAPKDPAALHREFSDNLRAIFSVLEKDTALRDSLADTLVAIGDSVPVDPPHNFTLSSPAIPFEDPRLFDYRNYPADLYVQPGTNIANRAALSRWAAWVNAFGHEFYERPLVLAASADLAESTNLSGFGKPYGEFAGYGWFDRKNNPGGVMLPQGITEFTNAGILAGLASVNFAQDPEKHFDGFWGACSTYGSFSYLKYGPFRLFSQLAQDCEWKVGKVIWVAGHSGPETADDSRTHFGIFEPGVTQLFPEGALINLHPWEYNEVLVLLGAALGQDIPLVALHLTRPPIDIPDRSALGIPSHFEAARGAYIVRDYLPGLPQAGAFYVQGASAMVAIVQLLPEFLQQGLNIKIVYVASTQLFAQQPESYRAQVVTPADRANSTVITTQARWLMHDWLFNRMADEYAVSSDWDNRWRTGGNVAEVIDEAHLSPEWVLKGIQRFASDRGLRLMRLQSEVAAAKGNDGD
jgi:transketolase